MKSLVRSLGVGLICISMVLQFACSTKAEDDSDNGVESAVRRGVFVDSPVKGLFYQSGGSRSGVTDSEGVFYYLPGRSLAFRIGGVAIGTLDSGSDLVTPFDFGHTAAVNIARFLQTLDADRNPDNGIDVTGAALLLENTSLDSDTFRLGDDAFESAIDVALGRALGPGAGLVPKENAIDHLVSATAAPFQEKDFFNNIRFGYFPDDDLVLLLSFWFGGFGEPNRVTLISIEASSGTGEDYTNQEYVWTLDTAGVVHVLDQDREALITIEKVGGSIANESIRLHDSRRPEPLLGYFMKFNRLSKFLVAGRSGRTYDVTYGSNTSSPEKWTFYPNGSLSRRGIESEVPEYWAVDQINRALVRVYDQESELTTVVAVSDGDVVNGGKFFVFDAAASTAVTELDDVRFSGFSMGALSPVIKVNTDGSVPYVFTTNTWPHQPFTGECVASSQCALAQLIGEWAASGSFDYNPVSSATISNFSGTLGTYSLSNDGFDITVLNDGCCSENEMNDYLAIEVDEIGVTIGDFRFGNAVMAWHEGSSGGTLYDFLANSDLPTYLPAHAGVMSVFYETDLTELLGAASRPRIIFYSVEAVPLSVNPQ